MVRFGTARCAFQSPYLTHRTPAWPVIIAYFDEPGPIPTARQPIIAAGVGRSPGSISHHRCALFRTQRLTPADLCRGSRGVPERPEAEAWKEAVMGKLEGKVAVITGGSSGMALASARRFVEEGAYVFITGRKQEALDQAVKLIGRDGTGVGGGGGPLR